MLQLRENEQLIRVVRQHWVIAGERIAISAALIGAPTLLFRFLSSAELFFNLNKAAVNPIIGFVLSLYALVVVAYLFLMLMDYYLDVWIITSQRIINIDQITLFSREVSEIPMNRVQDVTIDVKGVMATLFKFGTIRIQTAGEREFAARNIPHLYELKDAILQYSMKTP